MPVMEVRCFPTYCLDWAVMWWGFSSVEQVEEKLLHYRIGTSDVL